jgi:hypothetical protein
MRLSTVIMIIAAPITIGGIWLTHKNLNGSPIIAIGMGASMMAGYQRQQEDS